ncbi:hypothetical protein GCM10009718_19460 [Isoptericola halotolerans]|uniref:Uncharacterized protein n=1 Tax=Isoptericola halotolerans TaxID=300560 RepID=A0ABX2A6I7_9MICO|nr:hypothetical protein [Isoptericola halotolerans]NOV98470.1 hypothetical protein [Isoptericola halotolerans]
MNLQGPALEAELAYRRERAALAYGTPTTWARWRAWREARRQGRERRLSARARDAVERLADTIDTVADRTDARAWEIRMARRTTEIEAGLATLRAAHDQARRVA